MISCIFLLTFSGGKRGLYVINESDDEYSHNVSGANLTDSQMKSIKVYIFINN
jgi:hypothetical protein